MTAPLLPLSGSTYIHMRLSNAASLYNSLSSQILSLQIYSQTFFYVHKSHGAVERETL